MKKIYLLPLLLAVFTVKAQLTLTKAANEPVIGDMHKRIAHDSTTSVSRATGLGQLWNFTTLVTTTYTETSNYISVASTPSPGVFPTATLAEDQGNGYSYTMWKSTGTSWEIQGIQFPGTAVNFSNTAIAVTWPVSYGYSSSDTFEGSGTSGTTTASYDGNVMVSASGTGTVILPGGATFTNCLQVISTLIVHEVHSAGTSTMVQNSYAFYHASQKFPIITLRYTKTTNQSGTVNEFFGFVNAMTGPAGLKESIVRESIDVFPNPGKDLITVKLPDSSPVKITLYNALGKAVVEQSEPTINVKDLARGVYILTVKQNDHVYTKKLIVE